MFVFYFDLLVLLLFIYLFIKLFAVSIKFKSIYLVCY